MAPFCKVDDWLTVASATAHRDGVVMTACYYISFSFDRYARVNRLTSTHKSSGGPAARFEKGR